MRFNEMTIKNNEQQMLRSVFYYQMKRRKVSLNTADCMRKLCLVQKLLPQHVQNNQPKQQRKTSLNFWFRIECYVNHENSTLGSLQINQTKNSDRTIITNYVSNKLRTFDCNKGWRGADLLQPQKRQTMPLIHPFDKSRATTANSSPTKHHLFHRLNNNSMQ